MSRLLQDNSKTGLVIWINNLLKIDLECIEQLGTGAVYCQLFDAAFPNKINLTKVNWKAKVETEFLGNLKLLISAMEQQQVQKNIEIQKIAKLKFQDNFELMTWFKRFVIVSNLELNLYEPYSRRNATPQFPIIPKKEKKEKPSNFQVKIKDPSFVPNKPLKVPPKHIPEPQHPRKRMVPKAPQNKPKKQGNQKLKNILKIGSNLTISQDQRLEQIRKMFYQQKKSEIDLQQDKQQHTQVLKERRSKSEIIQKQELPIVRFNDLKLQSDISDPIQNLNLNKAEQKNESQSHTVSLQLPRNSFRRSHDEAPRTSDTFSFNTIDIIKQRPSSNFQFGQYSSEHIINPQATTIETKTPADISGSYIENNPQNSNKDPMIDLIPLKIKQKQISPQPASKSPNQKPVNFGFNFSSSFANSIQKSNSNKKGMFNKM